MRHLRTAGLAFAAVLALLPAAGQGGDIAPAERKSGFEMMGPDTQGLQLNDLANPAMLWVKEGERLWSERPAGSTQACAGCHGAVQDGAAPVSMRGVAARYPAFDTATGSAIDLAGRIRQCRTERQKAPPLAHESRALLALAGYVALQSRGLPISPPLDQRLAPARAEGQALFTARVGQLNLSCAQCHTDNWGGRLGGSLIPQAHPTGYPQYRLEWQAVGSLQRRLRNCLTGVRAEPYAFGAPELVALELYLMDRAAGMAMDAPAVRP